VEQMQLSPEIMEHARGAITFGITDPVQYVSGPAAYKSKLYRVSLQLKSASEHTNSLLHKGREANRGGR
jgi:hypothetical protein